MLISYLRMIIFMLNLNKRQIFTEFDAFNFLVYVNFIYYLNRIYANLFKQCLNQLKVCKIKLWIINRVWTYLLDLFKLVIYQTKSKIL